VLVGKLSPERYMATETAVSGRVALLLGFFCSLIAAGFFYQTGGLVMGLHPDWLEGGPSLLTAIALALLFEFGTPALCAATFFFGMRARALWSARIGMALAASAVVSYALFLRACYRLVHASSPAVF